MSSRYFLIPVFILSFQLSSQSQSRITDVRHDLFLSDSVVVYVGVLNRFGINNDDIKLLSVHKDLRVELKNGIAEVRVNHPGIFPVRFVTGNGIRRVVFISKMVSPDSDSY